MRFFILNSTQWIIFYEHLYRIKLKQLEHFAYSKNNQNEIFVTNIENEFIKFWWKFQTYMVIHFRVTKIQQKIRQNRFCRENSCFSLFFVFISDNKNQY